MNVFKFFSGIAMCAIPIIMGSLIGYYYRVDDWYVTLNKPAFTPPPITFAIVWPILYFTIGLSAFLALYGQKFVYWILPVIHLIANNLFSPITFGYHNLLGGSVIVTLTWVLGLGTTLQYGFINRSNVAMYLMIPYMLWVSFASVLSWSVFALNK
jgi:benzodiazapine receptor